MKKIIYVSLMVIVFASCSKYEDGPPLSLRSRTERLSNNWVAASALHNGTEGTADFNAQFSGYLLSIGKDEQYTLTYDLVPAGSHVEKGSWEFSDDKRHVLFTDANGSVHDYTILRLKEHELWVIFQDSNNTAWELHLVPKS
jgi:hypothetical protein